MRIPKTHHFNQGRVIAAFNYTSLSYFFFCFVWGNTKAPLAGRSFRLALRILFVFFFSHPPITLMFDQKIFTK